jgi:hypothetical protein
LPVTAQAINLNENPAPGINENMDMWGSISVCYYAGEKDRCHLIVLYAPITISEKTPRIGKEECGSEDEESTSHSDH